MGGEGVGWGMIRFGLFCALAISVQAAPLVVDDAKLIRQVQKELGKIGDDGKEMSGEELAKAVKEAPKTCEVELKGDFPTSASYADLTRSVFALTSVYKCEKCDKWHVGGTASAWCLSEDGVMVTNYHVLEGAKGAVYGVVSRDGEIWPVTEVLAADQAKDLAVFRVKGEGFQRLALGKAAEVGDKIRVISHPNRKFFLQTSGEVARYHVSRTRKSKAGSVRMTVTADYAKGSSGGPVFNERGEVVGVVANTQSIYYAKDEDGDQENLQMVVKDTVPVGAVKKMLDVE